MKGLNIRAVNISGQQRKNKTAEISFWDLDKETVPAHGMRGGVLSQGRNLTLLRRDLKRRIVCC